MRMCLFKKGLDLTQSNRGRLLQRITVHTRTDQRKSDGFQTVLHDQGKTIPGNMPPATPVPPVARQNKPVLPCESRDEPSDYILL